jgi:hypothetical protein
MGGGGRPGLPTSRTDRQSRGRFVRKCRRVSAGFGNELAKETEGIRLRDYALHLEGPGPFSSWKRCVPRQRWKEKTKDSILNHVASADSGILSFPGSRLRPGEPGERWTVMVGQGAAELGSAITGMLRMVLEDKVNDLERWDGTFAQRWLLLLNCYALADDTAEVEGALRRLARERGSSPVRRYFLERVPQPSRRSDFLVAGPLSIQAKRVVPSALAARCLMASRPLGGAQLGRMSHRDG